MLDPFAKNPKYVPEKVEKMYLCECYGEGLLLRFDKEDKSIDFSLWSFGAHYSHHRFGLKERLRWCWHILTKGYPFTDELILDVPTAKILAQDLLQLTEEK